MKTLFTAATLLLVGVAAQFGWKYVDHDPGAAWNASQAALLVFVLVMVVIAYRHSREVVAAGLCIMSWQALTAYCHAAWFFEPWPVEPGRGLCTDKFNLPLVPLAGGAAVWIAVSMLQSMRAKG